MLQVIYADANLQPHLMAPESGRAKHWERAEAIRELLRGRLEVSAHSLQPHWPMRSICHALK